MFEHQTHNIVVVGDMNPRIFHPSWFAKEGLIPESEAEGSRVEVIHPDVAVFSTNWLDIQVTRDRFIAKTAMEAYFEPLRDLVIGTFQQLSHTPATALGINFDMHIPMKGDKLDQLFENILPIHFWEERDIKPKLAQLNIRIDQPKGSFPDKFIMLQIQESNLHKDSLYLSFNNHFLLTSGLTDMHYCLEIVDALKSEWNSAQDYVIEITQKITR